MQTLSLTEPIAPRAAAPLPWRAVVGALRGDALATFPPEAYEDDAVVQSFLGRQHILLQSPEAIRHVLIENPQNYARNPTVLRILRPLFGRGLFLSSGEEWRRQRHQVAPAFAPRMVQSLAPQVVAAAESLAAELTEANEDTIDLVPRFQRLALDVIGGAIFSLDMTSCADELRHLFLRYAARLGRPSIADLVLPLAIPTPTDLARARFRRRWRRLIGRIIAERAGRGAGTGPRDLFDVLAAPDPATGRARDAENLGDQVATIVIAGHETTAAALFWAIHLLARHRTVQERVADEVAGFVLTPENAADTLPQLTYTRAVIDEVLRLFPPAFVVVRRALGDDIAGGVPVPRGTMVLIAPWVLHRHRRFWPQPQRFDPSRFLPGAPAPARFSYMPFGAGPRICVGAPFALTELVLAVATMVQAFVIEQVSRRPVNPVGLVTIQPDSPPRFRLRPRSDC